MDTTSRSLLRMSLADIARAAHVERPVVSMWRKRTNRAGVPFPGPVGDRDGHPEFDAQAVAAFLRATGLGNNAHAADDLIAHARPDGALAEGVSPELVTALLTVAARSTDLITDLDDEDLADFAAELDPDDRCLHREIDAALPLDPEVARYVDELADAAYSARAAVEVVARDAVRRVGGEQRRSVLDAAVTTAVAAVAVAVARATDVDALRFVDPTASDGRLLAAVADALDGETADFAMAGSDCAATRSGRCRLLIRDVSPDPVPVADDELDLGDSGVVVCALPTAAQPVMSVEQMLDALNDITLLMSPQHWGVLLAPSTVLTDKLPGSLVGLRDTVIRDGRLRMAVRFPAGLAVHQGQTHLALWVFGPATRDVPPPERGTVVADLSDAALTTQVVEELATDAVTSLTSVRLAQQVHAFHRSTIIPTTRLLSDSASLVADATPTTYADGSTTAERIEALRLAAGAAGQGWSAYAPPVEPLAAPPAVTLGRAMRSGWLRLVRGHRIAEDDIKEQSVGAPVIGTDELAGRSTWGGRRIDLLDLAASYPSAKLTEPGDVVFATGGEVVATVDRYGGAVVRSPARILRVRGAPPDGGVLLPDVIAAEMRSQPATARRVESWPVRLVPQHLQVDLRDRAAALAEAEEQLRAQLDAVHALQGELIHGVVSGRVRLGHSDIPTKDPSDQAHSADKETPK